MTSQGKDAQTAGKVLFLCTHNSARSQMAEGLVNHFFADRWMASSAGIERTRVHPLAITVMREIGIDISSHVSKTVSDLPRRDFDVVVTVCDNAGESCPFFPGKRVIHRSFEDPAAAKGTRAERLLAFRNVRDAILEWLESGFECEV